MGSYDFVTADKYGKKWLALFWPCLRIWLFFALFWTRFGPLAKSRSGNPGQQCNEVWNRRKQDTEV